MVTNSTLVVPMLTLLKAGRRIPSASTYPFGVNRAMTETRLPSQPENDVRHRLDSWKEIAAYVNRDVRTVQRWEKNEELPVRRHKHDKLSTVYAFCDELDRWLEERAPSLEETIKKSSLEVESGEVLKGALTAEPSTDKSPLQRAFDRGGE